MSPSVRYAERSGWPWWVHLLILGCAAACLVPFLDLSGEAEGVLRTDRPLGALLPPLGLGVGLPLLFYSIFGDLRTRITDGFVKISWGWSEIIRKRIAIDGIVRAEGVTYSPLWEFGGWGIRFGRDGRRAWNIRGNRAVRLEMADGKVFYLGSENPERIVGWIVADPQWIQSRPAEEEL